MSRGFGVHYVNAAMDHYRRLGFAVRADSGGGYGFASREGIEIHLGVVPDDDGRTGSAYLFVDDEDDLTQTWRSAGSSFTLRKTPNGGSTKARLSTQMATSFSLVRP